MLCILFKYLEENKRKIYERKLIKMKDYIVRKANETDLEAISTIYEKFMIWKKKENKQLVG